jgi:hypothetical protein
MAQANAAIRMSPAMLMFLGGEPTPGRGNKAGKPYLTSAAFQLFLLIADVSYARDTRQSIPKQEPAPGSDAAPLHLDLRPLPGDIRRPAKLRPVRGN